MQAKAVPLLDEGISSSLELFPIDLGHFRCDDFKIVAQCPPLFKTLGSIPEQNIGLAHDLFISAFAKEPP